MKTEHLSLSAALASIEEARPVINPNEGFLRQVGVIDSRPPPLSEWFPLPVCACVQLGLYHSMGCKVEEEHADYKVFKLEQMSKERKRRAAWLVSWGWLVGWGGWIFEFSVGGREGGVSIDLFAAMFLILVLILVLADTTLNASPPFSFPAHSVAFEVWRGPGLHPPLCRPGSHTRPPRQQASRFGDCQLSHGGQECGSIPMPEVSAGRCFGEARVGARQGEGSEAVQGEEVGGGAGGRRGRGLLVTICGASAVDAEW